MTPMFSQLQEVSVVCGRWAVVLAVRRGGDMVYAEEARRRVSRVVHTLVVRAYVRMAGVDSWRV